MRLVPSPSQPDWTTYLAWTDTGSLRFGLEGRVAAASPRELLCGALAACLDDAVRGVATRAGLPLARLAVLATADVGAGAAARRAAPVAVESLFVLVIVRLAGDGSAAAAERLVARARLDSIVLQTLQTAAPVRVVVDHVSSEELAA
jgi:uncharacterized OsmC-like protein